MTTAADPFPLWRFARSWAAAETREICSPRITFRSGSHIGWRRPAWAALIVTYMTLLATLGALLALIRHHGPLLVIASALLGATAGWGIYRAVAILGTWTGARRAQIRIWTQTAHAHGGAIARDKGDGIWEVNCVHAVPQGSGFGASIMHDLITQARSHGAHELQLTASHPDAARFYVRHGFTSTAPHSMRMKRNL